MESKKKLTEISESMEDLEQAGNRVVLQVGGTDMETEEILSQISQVIDKLGEAGTNSVIGKGHLTLIIKYSDSTPDLEKERLERVLAGIVKCIPLPLRGSNYIHLKRFTVDLCSCRIDVDLETATISL